MGNKYQEMINKAYTSEIRKDLIDIAVDKKKFVNEIKSGLGEELNKFENYIKPEPTLLQRVKNKINRFFKYF